MNELGFVFEESPWETYLNGHPSVVDAMQLLTLMEEESEDTVEETLEALDAKGIALDISGLPKETGLGEMARRLRKEAQLVESGFRFETLEENDPLRVYLEELAAAPAAGNEDILLADLARGRETAGEALTNLGLSRVVTLAGELAGHGVLLLDLIQEGSLGLWQAIGSFTDGDYAAHRDFYIRNAMARAIVLQARSNGLGRKTREAMEDYRMVDERLLGELGRNPTTEEMAEAMHMKPEEVETIAKMVYNARLLMKAKGEEPEEIPQEEDQAVEDTAYFQSRQRIMELMSSLSEEEVKLLSLRFGLDKGLPKTPEETGAILGMTSAEVTKKEAEILLKLRAEQ